MFTIPQPKTVNNLLNNRHCWSSVVQLFKEAPTQPKKPAGNRATSTNRPCWAQFALHRLITGDWSVVKSSFADNELSGWLDTTRQRGAVALPGSRVDGGDVYFQWPGYIVWRSRKTTPLDFRWTIFLLDTECYRRRNPADWTLQHAETHSANGAGSEQIGACQYLCSDHRMAE